MTQGYLIHPQRQWDASAFWLAAARPHGGQHILAAEVGHLLDQCTKEQREAGEQWARIHAEGLLTKEAYRVRHAAEVAESVAEAERKVVQRRKAVQRDNAREHNAAYSWDGGYLSQFEDLLSGFENLFDELVEEKDPDSSIKDLQAMFV